ncbi:Histone-lysine N-methyltransferase (Ash1), putative [Penicillium digitatum]|uniref:Histone-lysine N-methyltransferase (Ash1), putative n=3 Tax=Penicillium digitatum TaxID=36651 RepID=K9G3M4_PEND2|nr:Histone-lysine N-methyltransferase (Ash1), putative [Penicillium digitatum Pd1]EKV16615.1 Histone-lysine N-methyltransferase (Ash1), putative [Penicillium digitatum PHI26]EKV22005.1 Histone-lysine N-methyltransferase (Ash1), putative [Penicillium digitatum Pd1]QQK47858.1 Histone-lysine N-methyltransferase (Ash1), putative [Penicillium digitatum]
MAPRTSRSIASAAPDVQAHEPTDDNMSLDVPEQLLTPENSRSETSSNNENALTDEKPTGRRRSTRVVRASLRPGEPLEDTHENEGPAASSSEAYVESLAKAKRSHSSLRHSIAVMESSLWSGTPADDNTAANGTVAPDTPVSKSSQDLQSEDINMKLQQRTLRTRVGKALTEDKGTAKAEPVPSRISPRKSLRRSGRFSLMDRASDLVDRASSILGKRTRGLGDKDLGRRSSLRPRNITPSKDLSTANEPASKKRRVSESDLSKLQDQGSEPDEPAVPASPRPRRKIWLSHGLYTGQEPSDSPPKQRRSKNSKKTGTGPMHRTILPMPMFKGARLLKTGRDYQLPFDIFSPLPPGQPKPDEWRKTNKNVFVGDAGSFWKANKKLELSTCMCTEDTGCDENCQNRYMFYECDNGNCRLGPECGNRNFEGLKHRTKAGGKYNIGVEVIKTADRGYGVRSNRSFDPNQIIVEYTGEILTQLECEKRMRTVYKNNECYYLMYFDQNMIIDATRGSIARFVNHACEPNCRMEKWTVAGKPRMALFAGDRGISTGEELSYDYNFDPYSNKNVQQCRCGSANCRGFLGPRLKDKQQRAKELEKRKAEESMKKATTKTVIGKKRKVSEEPESDDSQSKKRKISKSKVKASVKKAVATVRGKKTTKTTAKGTTTTAVKSKTNVKLPTVKATGRIKATVRAPRSNKVAKQSPASPKKTTSQLKRPSAETKKLILAAASKGSGASPRKPAPKAKSTAKGSFGKGVKSAAQRVLKSVKGTKN